jgi:conjugal transfer pilus assembly protein TraV
MSPAALGLSGCAAVGSMMSPYSEKFSCKNSDHGQCIHPEKAYADAVAGRTSNPILPSPTTARCSRCWRLQGARRVGAAPVDPRRLMLSPPERSSAGKWRADRGPGFTPMLKPSRTLRTLILPYADRQRPDRLYMARYVYSIIDRPAWVVGDYLVEPGAERRPRRPADGARDGAQKRRGRP